MVYVTRGLLSVLLETAAEAEPESVTVALSATPAGALSGVGDSAGPAGSSADRDGAESADRDGAESADRDGAESADRDGAESADRDDRAADVEDSATGHDDPSAIPDGTSARQDDTSARQDDTSAGPDDLPPDAPVYTHMYLPETGGSVTAVFGMDLSTPAGEVDGRFISHPRGDLSVSTTDDLHDVLLVAVPPWEPDSVATFDRRGRRRPFEVVDAVPPEESLP